MSEKYDLIILFSGGSDSVCMAELANVFNLNPYFIMIDYNQFHVEELDKAVKYVEELGGSTCYTKVKIDVNLNSALTGNGDKNNSGFVSPYHVPMRNTIFLSIACAYAESMNIPLVWLGADYSDAINNFCDCKQNYILKFNELLKFASPANISIEAPLMGLTKEKIIEMLKYFGVDMNIMYSGYGIWT